MESHLWLEGGSEWLRTRSSGLYLSFAARCFWESMETSGGVYLNIYVPPIFFFLNGAE